MNIVLKEMVYLDEKPIHYLMYADDIVLLPRTTNKTE
jgi:hypothetical protein